jgi:type IV pilus assembly protein PilM
MKFPLKKKSKPTIGLDIGSHTIKLVEFAGEGTQRTVRKIGRAVLPREAIVDGTVKDVDAVTATLNALIDNLNPKHRYASTSISGYSIILKKVELPYVNEREIEDNLIAEAEKYVPFEIDDVYVDFHVINLKDEEHGSTSIFLVAAKKEIVDEYARIIESVGLTPAVIDVYAFALGNAFEAAYGVSEEPVLLVDIGAHKTNLSVVVNGTNVFARDMAFGGAQLTEAIHSATGLNYDDAEQAKIKGTRDNVLMSEISSICKELGGLWIEEINKAIEFFKSGVSSEQFPVHIFLSGGASMLRGFDRRMAEETGMEVTYLEPFHGMKKVPEINSVYLESTGPQMAICSGLATRTREL